MVVLKMKNKRTILIVVVALLLVVTIGFTYAFFTATVNGNDNAQDQVVETGTLSLVYKDGQEVSLIVQFQGKVLLKHLQ